ncbi:MAG: DUF427 domain-containing protein [Paracoccaceae bacterium]
MAEIEIKPAGATVVVRAGGAVLAESTRAMTLFETGYEPVHYIPRDDVAMAFLDASDTRTRCPHKGEATYFHLALKSGTLRDAAWSYPEPHEGVARIAGLVAFDAGKVAVEEL